MESICCLWLAQYALILGYFTVWPQAYGATLEAQGEESLPEISRFLSIIIARYYRVHRPPHLHAKYGRYEVVVAMTDGVVEGRFPRRALQHVLEWYATHQQALLETGSEPSNGSPSSLSHPWSKHFGAMSLYLKIHRCISSVAPVC